jgi:hypothetical protein
MKKSYLSLLVVCFLLVSTGLRAQMYYTFQTLTQAYVQLDTQANLQTATITGTADEGWTNLINFPAGFQFYYNSNPVPYTAVSASTNGFAALGTALTSAMPSNNLQSGGGTNRPLLAPLWDDLKLLSTNDIKYVTTGTAPNRVFTMEWQGVIFPTNATPTSASLTFEMKLYEGFNVVDFTYNSTGSPYAGPSAAIGITAATTGPNQFMSVQSGNIPTTVSTTYEVDTINNCPPTGGVYRFLPYCPTPSGLLASCVSYFGADISWAAPTFVPNGPVGYEYIVDQVSLTPNVAGTPSTTPYVTVTGLLPQTQYYIHVRTNCGMGNFSAWQTATFTTAPYCIPPLLYVSSVYTDVNTAGGTVNWSAAGITDYEWILDQSPAAPTGNGNLTQGITKTFTGLLANTTYYFHLRSACTQCNHSPWVTVTFTTPPRCTQPLNLAINSITQNSADLSWDPVNFAVGYQYAVDQSYNPPLAGTFTTGTTAIAGGLLSGAVYYLHVRTDCDSGNYSPWSTETFTTVDPVCQKPHHVHQTAATANTATFAWTVANGNSGYEVVVDQNSAVQFGEQVNATGFPGFTATGLTPATGYWFHVRTKCDVNHHSFWLDTPFRTDWPTGVTNIVPSDNKLSLSAYPNPTGDRVTISIDGPQYSDAQMSLTDINGKLITYIAIIDKKAIVDLSKMPQALYFVKYTDKYNTEVIKIYKR